MMTIISIEPYDNGAHWNQTSSVEFPIPEGCALLPEEVGTPETLENFPFGEITTTIIDDVPVVTSWKPLPMPDPEPIEETVPKVSPYETLLDAVIQ